ncbi:hypothetical protein BMS3Bbin04_01583 [bacterium BMS3Bbin04]|nr:hypothetical protein BMS3Bbin04_01583 [bacterium BMS3Bbin04]
MFVFWSGTGELTIIVVNPNIETIGVKDGTAGRGNRADGAERPGIAFTLKGSS